MRFGLENQLSHCLMWETACHKVFFFLVLPFNNCSILNIHLKGIAYQRMSSLNAFGDQVVACCVLLYFHIYVPILLSSQFNM